MGENLHINKHSTAFDKERPNNDYAEMLPPTLPPWHVMRKHLCCPRLKCNYMTEVPSCQG